MYREYRTLPVILCFEKLDPRQSSWKSSKCHKHGFVFWAQREPNAILEIYVLDECKNHDCALLDNKLTIIYTHPVSLELPEELSPIFAISISKLDGNRFKMQV